MKEYRLLPCTKEAKHWKEYQFFCCVDSCGKIRNGSSKYCIQHEGVKHYEKSDPFVKKLIMELLKGLRRPRRPKLIKEGDRRWGKSVYEHF